MVVGDRHFSLPHLVAVPLQQRQILGMTEIQTRLTSGVYGKLALSGFSYLLAPRPALRLQLSLFLKIFRRMFESRRVGLRFPRMAMLGPRHSEKPPADCQVPRRVYV